MGTSMQAKVWQRVLTKKQPFRVSRRSLSTALWVALCSAAFARLLGFLFPARAGKIIESTSTRAIAVDLTELQGAWISSDGEATPKMECWVEVGQNEARQKPVPGPAEEASREVQRSWEQDRH